MYRNILLAIILLSFSGCKKEEDSPYVAGGKDVYVIGNDEGFPTIWENGVGTKIPSTYGSTAISAFKIANDIYVGGAQAYINQPVYWKNGVAVLLPLNRISTVDGIFVLGDDVYCVSSLLTSIGIQNTTSVPVFWKNKIGPTTLPHIGYSSAKCIAVSGNDVYIVGTDEENAVYWKNGIKLILPSTGITFAEAISVSDSDIYIAGSEKGGILPIYWKNGLKVSLPLSADAVVGSASGIFISGKDVYVAGEQKNTKGFRTATYWKNGAPWTANVPSAGRSIFVSGSDVYLAGTLFNQFNSAVYWKNGAINQLPSSFLESRAFFVYVK